MSKSTILAIIILALATCYGFFHAGRYFERREVTENLRGMFENTTDADFIIPDDLEFGGEMAVGNCVYGKGGDYMTKLGRYTYNW